MNLKFLTILLLPRIKNVEYPVCKNCVYYIEHKDYSLSRCAFLGEKNIITGEITYKYAELSRNGDCDKTGKYYKEK